MTYAKYTKNNNHNKPVIIPIHKLAKHLNSQCSSHKFNNNNNNNRFNVTEATLQGHGTATVC